MGLDSYIEECKNYCKPCIFEQFCAFDGIPCLALIMVLIAEDYILRGEM